MERTHSRYKMNQKFYKKYVKCSCGTLLILTSLDWTTCTGCQNKFMAGYGMTQPGGQYSDWPTALKRFYRYRSSQSIPAGCGLMSTSFKLGRHTKRMLKEIEDLGGEVSVDMGRCVDGRLRIQTLRFEFRHTRAAFEGCIYFDIYPDNRNNKIVNERVSGFLDDLRNIKRFMNDNEGKLSGFEPEHFGSSERVVVETMMEYTY